MMGQDTHGTRIARRNSVTRAFLAFGASGTMPKAMEAGPGGRYTYEGGRIMLLHDREHAAHLLADCIVGSRGEWSITTG